MPRISKMNVGFSSGFIGCIYISAKSDSLTGGSMRLKGNPGCQILDAGSLVCAVVEQLLVL